MADNFVNILAISAGKGAAPSPNQYFIKNTQSERPNTSKTFIYFQV